MNKPTRELCGLCHGHGINPKGRLTACRGCMGSGWVYFIRRDLPTGRSEIRVVPSEEYENNQKEKANE